MTIISDYSEGGLKMVDLESQIKALTVMWVKRLCDNTPGSWKVFTKEVLKPYRGVPPLFYDHLFFH